MTELPYAIGVVEAHDNFNTWVNREHIDDALRSQLGTANVLIVPCEGFREESIIAFPVLTEGLYHFLRDNAPDGMTVDLCAKDEDYHELALHSDLLMIGYFVVTNAVFPVLVGLLTDYIKAKLSRRAKDSTVKVQFTVVEADQSSRSLTYEGPPEYLGEIITGGKDGADAG